MDRREFIRDAAVGAAALSLSGLVPAAAEGEARVVVVHLEGVGNLLGETKRAAIAKMVSAGMKRLTGVDGSAAWRRFVKPDDVVALKVNCLAARCATSPELADVAAAGVMSAGVSGEHTLVYERTQRELTAAGYKMGPQPGGYRVVATDGDGYGWSKDTLSRGGVTQNVTSILTEHAGVLINLAMLKDHNIAGVTASMKNHFGDIKMPWQLHGNHGDPHIADVASLGPIRNKQKLILTDAMTVVYDGGPVYNPRAMAHLDTILLATDTVANDFVGWKLIDQIRVQKGMKPVAQAGREPAYIRSAADRGLGVADEARISIERVEVT
jgi:uncharacterized protein (DUF362 family)